MSLVFSVAVDVLSFLIGAGVFAYAMTFYQFDESKPSSKELDIESIMEAIQTVERDGAGSWPTRLSFCLFIGHFVIARARSARQ